MKIKCVVACRNAAGEPDFCPALVECSETDYHDGFHYDTAEYAACCEGYETEDAVVFDEKDGPAWLFEHFTWDMTPVEIHP